MRSQDQAAGTSRATNAWAVVPAAGISRRMGRSKLLLPWGTTTLIEHVLGVWRSSPVRATVVVVHPDARELHERCREAGAHVVIPDHPPPEMKDSVRLGLEYVERQFDPGSSDLWLMSPADVPGLSPDLIAALIAAHHQDTDAIWVPERAGRRGHPVLLPWALVNEVNRLPPDRGVDSLLEKHRVELLPWTDEAICQDMDTPEDYRRLKPG